MDRKFVAAIGAEFLGTFALTFIGGGAIINGAAGLIGVALAHGLALCVMVSALGGVSGGQFNPAVTLGLLSIGKMTPRDAIAYWIAQCAGGIAAGFTLAALPMGTKAALLGATPQLAKDVGMGTGILVESILTFFLLTAVLLTAVDKNAPRIAGFGIGLTVTMDILMGGPVTGAAMNQARWLGTGIASGSLPDPVVYLVGPAVGAVAAAQAYKLLFSSEARGA